MKLSDKQMAQAIAAARVELAANSPPFIDLNSKVPDDKLTGGIAQMMAAVDPSPWVATPSQMAAMDATLRQAISDTGVVGNDAGASFPQAQVDAVIQALLDAANGAPV